MLGGVTWQYLVASPPTMTASLSPLLQEGDLFLMENLEQESLKEEQLEDFLYLATHLDLGLYCLPSCVLKEKESPAPTWIVVFVLLLQTRS